MKRANDISHRQLPKLSLPNGFTSREGRSHVLRNRRGTVQWELRITIARSRGRISSSPIRNGEGSSVNAPHYSESCKDNVGKPLIFRCCDSFEMEQGLWLQQSQIGNSKGDGRELKVIRESVPDTRKLVAHRQNCQQGRQICRGPLRPPRQ